MRGTQGAPSLPGGLAPPPESFTSSEQRLTQALGAGRALGCRPHLVRQRACPPRLHSGTNRCGQPYRGHRSCAQGPDDSMRGCALCEELPRGRPRSHRRCSPSTPLPGSRSTASRRHRSLGPWLGSPSRSPLPGADVLVGSVESHAGCCAGAVSGGGWGRAGAGLAEPPPLSGHSRQRCTVVGPVASSGPTRSHSLCWGEGPRTGAGTHGRAPHPSPRGPHRLLRPPCPGKLTPSLPRMAGQRVRAARMCRRTCGARKQRALGPGRDASVTGPAPRGCAQAPRGWSGGHACAGCELHWAPGPWLGVVTTGHHVKPRNPRLLDEAARLPPARHRYAAACGPGRARWRAGRDRLAAISGMGVTGRKWQGHSVEADGGPSQASEAFWRSGGVRDPILSGSSEV